MGALLGTLAGIGTSVGGASMSMASCVACQACSCASSVACSYLCGFAAWTPHRSADAAPPGCGRAQRAARARRRPAHTCVFARCRARMPCACRGARPLARRPAADAERFALVCCTLRSKVCGASSKEKMVSHTSRITYFGLFLVTVICAWVFRDYQSPEFCTATNDIFW